MDARCSFQFPSLDALIHPSIISTMSTYDIQKAERAQFIPKVIFSRNTLAEKN